eukprot:404358-Pelagomonas_calceolata.AAC.1
MVYDPVPHPSHRSIFSSSYIKAQTSHAKILSDLAIEGSKKHSTIWVHFLYPINAPLKVFAAHYLALCASVNEVSNIKVPDR